MVLEAVLGLAIYASTLQPLPAKDYSVNQQAPSAECSDVSDAAKLIKEKGLGRVIAEFGFFAAKEFIRDNNPLTFGKKFFIDVYGRAQRKRILRDAGYPMLLDYLKSNRYNYLVIYEEDFLGGKLDYPTSIIRIDGKNAARSRDLEGFLPTGNFGKTTCFAWNPQLIEAELDDIILHRAIQIFGGTPNAAK